MQKSVLQGRALLLIAWVFGYFLGFFVESARAGDYHEDLEEHIRIAKKDPYYNAQFNPIDDIRLQAVILLKPEEGEWLLIQKALYDSSCWVRGAAVSKLNSPQYNNLLWEIFYKEDSWYVRGNTLYNLVKNMDTTEKDLAQKEFIEIIMDNERYSVSALDGLDKQKNQDFFVYLVARDIVGNNGYITGKCDEALMHINLEERRQLVEYIKNHFPDWKENDWQDILSFDSPIIENPAIRDLLR